jgi:hypothetical protein
MQLVGHTVGRPGQGRVSLSADVPINRVRIAVWCLGVDVPTVATQTKVQGLEESFAQEATSCTAEAPALLVPRDAARGFWAGGSGPPAYVTLPDPSGGPLTVTTRLARGSDLSGARLAIALYAVPRPVDTVAGLDLYERWYDGERTKSLVAFGDRGRGSTGVVVEVPPTAGPTVAYWTYTLYGETAGELELLVDGSPADWPNNSLRVTPGGGGGGELQLTLASGKAHVVELRIAGVAPTSVTVAMVFYVALGKGLR